MEEIWKDVKGYKGLYQVSNLGRVKSLKRKIWNGRAIYIRKEKMLAQATGSDGYLLIALCGNNKAKPKTKKVHRLVAEAFIPNPENKPQVNHIDGNKQNNCINNLEWCTCKENVIHAWKNGLAQITKKQSQKAGQISGKLRNKKVNQYDTNGNFLKTWNSLKEASKYYNIDDGTICKCCKGKRNTCGGFIWKYK